MPARSTWDGDVTVYPLGVPSWADLDDEGMRQLRLAHDLRNDLVSIEHRYETAKAAVWSQYQAIDEAEAAVAAAQETVDGLQQRARDERKADRTTRTRADTAAELRTAKAELREAKATRTEVKGRLYPEAKERLLVVRQARDAARKALYPEYRGRGLYWATINDVLQSHDTAAQRITELRKEGKPAQLRHRRWRGEGTITVQLQRGRGKPARTWELLTSGEGPWRNVLRFDADDRVRTRYDEHGQPTDNSRGQDRRWDMTFSLGSDAPPVRLPVVVDRKRRPGPDDDITMARITRRRIAGQTRLRVTLTCRTPAPEAQAGALISVHLGWRALPDGDLRVAMVTADRPLGGPPEWLPVRRVGHGWEVRLPEMLRHAPERTEKLRSTRDQALNALREDLAGWLDEHPQPDPDGGDAELTGGRVRQWRSPARFATLELVWRDAPPAGAEEIVRRLSAWRRQDRHLWEWEAHERDQVAGRIRHLWLDVAAWLGRQAGMVVVDDTPIGEVTRVPGVDGGEDSLQARASRAQRQAASPGELRAAVKQAAMSRGAQAEALRVPGGRQHAGCGADLVGDRAQQVSLWCPSCGVGVDQDLDAAEHLLAAASAPVED